MPVHFIVDNFVFIVLLWSLANEFKFMVTAQSSPVSSIEADVDTVFTSSTIWLSETPLFIRDLVTIDPFKFSFFFEVIQTNPVVFSS
jgi:hypothetical protein